MKLGMQVGLGPGHTVLDGDPPPPPPKGHRFPPIFDPYLLRPNGCMDQDVTWYGGRPRPTWDCVRCGPSYTPRKRAHPPHLILAHVYCGQMAGWNGWKTPLGTEVDLGPGHIVLDGGPSSRERAQQPPPSFRPMSIQSIYNFFRVALVAMPLLGVTVKKCHTIMKIFISPESLIR